MVAYNFNAQQYEPRYGGGGSLPPGKYKGIIVDSSQEPTSKGNGGFLALTIQVLEGVLAGQKTTDRLMLHHPNPQTVEIANKQLSAYCHVLGVYAIQDTGQLHNIPFCFEVGWQKGNEPTEARPEGGYTEIKAIADINGNEPGKGAKGGPAHAQQPIPQQPAGGVQPAGGGWGGSQPATAQPSSAAQPNGNGSGWGNPGPGAGGGGGNWGQPAGQPQPQAWQPNGQPNGGNGAGWGQR